MTENKHNLNFVIRWRWFCVWLLKCCFMDCSLC